MVSYIFFVRNVRYIQFSMNSLDRGFDVALTASLLSDAPRPGLRMGAALYSGSRLLSVGFNRWHTHPKSDNRNFNQSLHAEHVALLRRQHFDNPKNLILYVARKRSDGIFGCSKPCNNCQQLCSIAGVSRIRYFDTHGKVKELVL